MLGLELRPEVRNALLGFHLGVDFKSGKNMRSDHTHGVITQFPKKLTFVHTENVLITPSKFDHTV